MEWAVQKPEKQAKERNPVQLEDTRGNHWTGTSVAAALGFRWDGENTRLFARTKPDSFNTESVVVFLKELKTFVGGNRVILVWDHLPAHRSKRMNQFLLDQRDWLSIEWLPGYAPDLNPTEAIWNNIKSRELANFCADHIEQAKQAFRKGLRRSAHSFQLPVPSCNMPGFPLSDL